MGLDHLQQQQQSFGLVPQSLMQVHLLSYLKHQGHTSVRANLHSVGLVTVKIVGLRRLFHKQLVWPFDCFFDGDGGLHSGGLNSTLRGLQLMA